jgi:hypothetical protein
MTGYTVHTGASKKFVSGWDRVFGASESKPAAKKTQKKAGKKSPKKDGK